MKKILTLTVIATIFAFNFANASTLNGGKNSISVKVKTVTSKNNQIKYVKFSAKDFSVKKMQDTKDILMTTAPLENAFAGR